MTRLRHRALSALSRAPGPGLVRIARYLAYRRATRRALVRDAGLDEVLARLDRAPRRAAPPREDLELAIEVGDAMVAAARRARIVRREDDTCLVRALARYALLVEHTCEAALCIGIDPARVHDADAVELGHAWVEVDDVPLLGERLPVLVRSFRHAYTVTVEHPPASPA